MKLWILRPRKDLPDEDWEDTFKNPWEPWYDKTFGFVVRANTGAEARGIAQVKTYGDEVGKKWDGWNRIPTIPAWTDPQYSTCVELTADGTIGVVMKDFHSA